MKLLIQRVSAAKVEVDGEVVAGVVLVGLLLLTALLATFALLYACRGEDEQGRPIEVRHPLAEVLRDRAVAGGSDPVKTKRARAWPTASRRRACRQKKTAPRSSRARFIS